MVRGQVAALSRRFREQEMLYSTLSLSIQVYKSAPVRKWERCPFDGLASYPGGGGLVILLVASYHAIKTMCATWR